MKLNYIAAALLFLVAPSVFGAPPAVIPSPAQPVVVTNPPSNPVPVTLQGAGAISGTVSIGNIVNIKDFDNPGRDPYQNSFSLQIDPGASATKFNSFAVDIPENTRLVIDRVNVLGELPVGQTLIGVNISAFVDGAASGNFVGTTFHGTSPSGVIFGGPLDIFVGDSGPGLAADRGDFNISLSAFRNQTTGAGHVFVQVFGHLVALP